MTLGKELHNSNIHSILWEDCEPSMGSQPKDIISADSEKAIVFDLVQGEAKEQIDAAS